MLAIFTPDTGTGIADGNPHLMLGRQNATHSQCPIGVRATLNRFDGVSHQVQQYLFDLNFVGLDVRQPVYRFNPNVNSVLLRLRLDERYDGGDGIFNAETASLWRTFCDKLSQPVDDLAGALGRRLDFSRHVGHGLCLS